MDQVLLRVIGLVCIFLASTSQLVSAKDTASKPANLSCGAKSQEACRTWADEFYGREEFESALSLYTELCEKDLSLCLPQGGLYPWRRFHRNPNHECSTRELPQGL